MLATYISIFKTEKHFSFKFSASVYYSTPLFQSSKKKKRKKRKSVGKNVKLILFSNLSIKIFSHSIICAIIFIGNELEGNKPWGNSAKLGVT